MERRTCHLINISGGACKCGVQLCIVVSQIGVTATRLFCALVFPSVGQDRCNNQTKAGYPERLHFPSFRFAVVNFSETWKYVQAALVQASLPTTTENVNPRDSISGFLRLDLQTTTKKLNKCRDTAGVWSTAHSTSQEVTKVRTHAHMQSLACRRTHGTNACLTALHFYLWGIQ